METAEILLFWVTVFIYVFVFSLHLFGFVYQKERLIKIAMKGLWVGLFCHTVTGVVRWISGGHPPVTDTYELNLTGTWVTILVLVLFMSIGKLQKPIGLLVMPLVFIVMGYGYMLRASVTPMGPAFQSAWLVVHVLFAWLAFGFYAISTGAASALLLRKPLLSWKPELKIPTPEELDLTSYRFIILGFINHAIMLVAGAIWAKNLWGHYWSWDALETWSLIAFLYYAFYLHMRSLFNWKMKKAAWLTILGLFILAISFWGVGWFGPTIHPGP